VWIRYWITWVTKLTNNQQVPYKTGVITENFYFKPGKSDQPGLPVTVDKPFEPAKPVTPKTYYYYIDQDGNESQNRFNDRKAAENEMRSRKLYGRIYNNVGEEFVVSKPAEPVAPTVQPTEPVKTVTAAKRNGEVWNPDGIEMVFVQFS